MIFKDPILLFLLLAIPVLVAIYFYSNYRRKKNIELYGDKELMKALLPRTATIRSRITFWLLLAAFALMVFVLARPRYGTKKETIVSKGVEVIVALDISNSMMAEDITPNRLEKAKRLISRMIAQTKGNKFSLIVFAGDAFVQLPITTDHVSANMFLNQVTPALIKRQGTNVGDAIDLACRSFSDNEKIGKAIVLITDGENHEGGAEEAARRAAEQGIKVYVMGIGTTKGGRIPTGKAGDFLRDREGNIVVTKLNEPMAQSIAAAGNGTYIRVDNTNSAQELIEGELEKLTKDDVKSEVYTKFREQFVPIAILVLILLMADSVAIAIIDYVSRPEKRRKEKE
ncbi:MAG: VWA domain-containing protein [Bacteroidaceae bacterium]|nr:VWA domain-containing protein [Bacteroidaceae bacterium]